jgi:hypothetical protein
MPAAAAAAHDLGDLAGFSMAWEIAWPLAGAAEAATLPTKLTPAAMIIASTI